LSDIQADLCDFDRHVLSVKVDNLLEREKQSGIIQKNDDSAMRSSGSPGVRP
jgi:hypothetical protein